MKTFYMTVTETLQRTIKVQANDADEAYEKIEDACCDGTIDLGWADFVDRGIDDVTERYSEVEEMFKIQEI